MTTTTPDFERMLREAGLRVTAPRVGVLAAVHALPHSDTGTILHRVRSERASVSHQAVYDCLHTLTTAGLLRRLEPSGSVARYEPQIGDNHHHLVCRA
ncbi:Fur family transcriptional regulator, partial [Metallococcus carri]